MASIIMSSIPEAKIRNAFLKPTLFAKNVFIGSVKIKTRSSMQDSGSVGNEPGTSYTMTTIATIETTKRTRMESWVLWAYNKD